LEKGAAGIYQHVFGPVPSRRLGVSLGLDLVPAKTCTLDCLYCEVGRTTRQTVERFRPGTTEIVLSELAAVLPDWEHRLDYVTLAGSGEPTLNEEIGRIIAGVRSLTDVPTAVLTNGTLLNRPEVREALLEADLVLPSLDTARPETFGRLNRPHPDLEIEELIEGLVRFSRAFRGDLWLEILLVAGFNDGEEELAALKDAVGRIRPDRVQLNTVYRPPAYRAAGPLSREALDRAASFFGPRAEVVAGFSGGGPSGEIDGLGPRVLAMLARRPCTRDDVAAALGLTAERASYELSVLEKSGRVRTEKHDRNCFFRQVG